jgi:hypothetical protein
VDISPHAHERGARIFLRRRAFRRARLGADSGSKCRQKPNENDAEDREHDHQLDKGVCPFVGEANEMSVRTPAVGNHALRIGTALARL